MRSTKGHRNNRRAHFALSAPRFSVCAHCGKRRLSHTACRHCGYYGERSVVDVAKRIAKRQKKQAEREKAAGK